jgi:large conductance mechanosensitive channel
MRKKLEHSVKKANGFLKEFKSFALKKNVVDLAVAVVVGGAFGKIVTSLVNDIIMPLLSLLLGTENFSQLKLVLRQATQEVTEVSLNYGAFIQTLVDFFIIAFCIFIAIKVMTKAQKTFEKMIDKLDGEETEEQKVEAPAPPKLTKDQELLTEIVTLLKHEKKKE